MATKINVNGRLVQRPGVYAYILSGIQNPPLNLSYGNICIIDDGIGASFSGGSGVNGAFKQGKDSIYNFTSVQDFQAFVKGGELWNLAQPLFKPISNNPLINGISRLTYIRAATTTSATVAMSLTHGTVSFKTRDEGLTANGALTGDVLTSGYGAMIIDSPSTSGKYRLQIYHSTYKGLDSLNNAPYDGIVAANTKAVMVVESPDVRTIGELVTWMQTDTTFNQGFQYLTSNIPATTTTTTTTSGVTTTTTTGAGTTTTTTTTAIPLGVIVSGDVTGTYTLASGGTETFGSTDFDDALAAIKDVDHTFFLCMKSGSLYNHANNVKIFDFITSGDSKFEKFMVVAAGYNKADLTSISQPAADYYDNDSVIVSHGGGKRTSRLIGGFTMYSQLHVAATFLGRTCGLPPQVPSTLKSIGYDGLVHILNSSELDYCLDNGIICYYYDDELEANVVLQDVNTLQNNEFLLNEDNTSFCIQLKRIEAFLNKTLIVNGKKRFYGNATSGGNRNSISPAEVTTWLAGQLSAVTASDKKDDLIVGWRNIVVTSNQDNTTATYEFGINNEQSKIVFVGTAIDF